MTEVQIEVVGILFTLLILLVIFLYREIYALLKRCEELERRVSRLAVMEDSFPYHTKKLKMLEDYLDIQPMHVLDTVPKMTEKYVNKYTKSTKFDEAGGGA